MGIKELICGALDAADNALNCDAPQPSNPILCFAVNAAQDALQCDSVGPGQGCSVTGCDPGYYCDTVQDICLNTKSYGDQCSLDNECQSGICEIGIALHFVPGVEQLGTSQIYDLVYSLEHISFTRFSPHYAKHVMVYNKLKEFII